MNLRATVAIFAVAFSSLPSSAGQVAISYNATDCPFVAGFETFVAPITAATPNPTPANATVGASFPNTGPECGVSKTKLVTVGAAGNHRFWLRTFSNTTPVVQSGFSNAKDALLPLASPVLNAVAPQ